MASVIDSDHFRGRAAASRGAGGNGGGTVDDILRRLGILESSVAEIRADVSEIKGMVPHLATKAEITVLRGEISEIKGTLPHIATKADVLGIETRMIKWMIGTVITSVALAFTIAKFVI